MTEDSRPQLTYLLQDAQDDGVIASEAADRWSREMQLGAAWCTAAMMVCGVAGNVLTLAAMCRDRRLRTSAGAFIASLCVSDLVFCLTVLPFAVWRWAGGGWQAGPELCHLVPVLRYGNVGTSLLSIAMISVNRWLLVERRGAWHHVVFTRTGTSLLVASCWLVGYGLQLPAALGVWGRTGYDPRLRTCTILPDRSGRSPKTALFVLGFAVPCLVIVACYARIYLAVRASHRRLHRHQEAAPDPAHRRSEWRVTRMVLAIFLCFLICYLPITLVKTLDPRAHCPPAHVAGYLLLYASSCINPLIYVTMNKQYRRAYAAALRCGSHSASLCPATTQHQPPPRPQLQGTAVSVLYSPDTKLHISTTTLPVS